MSVDACARWWETDPSIRASLGGVFEGGGAKGVAYVGALCAVRCKGYWFNAVAGASAGAITATLVAAGLTPEDIAKQTRLGFRKFRKPWWVTGLRHLRGTSGYLDASELQTWLDDILKFQYECLTDGDCRMSGKLGSRDSVTFSELKKASGIDLYVVAADLTTHEQMVFSPAQTPGCSVVDAVLASSAIPGVFPSGELRFSDGLHTIVDGGVWSNFPMFVFDSDYRTYTDGVWRLLGETGLMEELFGPGYQARYEVLKPNSPEPVLGFVLEEERTRAQRSQFPDFGVAFRDPQLSYYQVEPVEWSGDDAKEPISLPSIIMAPLRWLPQLASGRSRNASAKQEYRGRWPPPKGRWTRVIVGWLDDIAGSVYPIPYLVVAWLTLATMVGFGVWKLADLLSPVLASEATGWWQGLVSTAALTAFVVLVSVVVLITLVTLVGVVACSLLVRTVRRVGYGLVRTYVASTGARPWAGLNKDEHVIRLPIPRTLTTMSFDVTDENGEFRQEIKGVIKGAYRETRKHLRDVLGDDPPNPATRHGRG